MSPLHPGLASEIQKLAPSAVIELFELDATSLGGEVYCFHSGTNGLNQEIVWNGVTYGRYPIEATGFEFSGNAQVPRPKIRVSNILSAITTLLLEFDDLIGAKFTRRRTLAKYLDAVNFSGSVNPSADPTAEFPVDIYFVDRKSNEDRNTVEFELAAGIDLIGIQLPRRQVIQNICVWKYRGPECSYTGAPIWDQNDSVISSPASSQAQALIAAFNAREAARADLAAKQTILNNSGIGAACDLVEVSENFFIPTSGNAGAYYVLLGPGGAQYGDAYFNGNPVTLGGTYRIGADHGLDPRHTYVQAYAIEYWAVDSSACTAATNAYNTAIANRDAAQVALDTAEANLVAAYAALPANDPIYTQERCGKRLASCKLRFGDNNPLPYGSFPSAGLTK